MHYSDYNRRLFHKTLINGTIFSVLDFFFSPERTRECKRSIVVLIYLESHYYNADAATSGNRSLLYLLLFVFSLCLIYFYLPFCLSHSISRQYPANLAGEPCENFFWYANRALKLNHESSIRILYFSRKCKL